MDLVTHIIFICSQNIIKEKRKLIQPCRDSIEISYNNNHQPNRREDEENLSTLLETTLDLESDPDDTPPNLITSRNQSCNEEIQCKP